MYETDTFFFIVSGTLSVKAVEMFNHHRNASLLCLKPCCLPEWTHTYTHDAWVFQKTTVVRGENEDKDVLGSNPGKDEKNGNAKDEAKEDSNDNSNDFNTSSQTNNDTSNDSTHNLPQQHLQHNIPTQEVCAPGKWIHNKWVGPPRSHLKVKFDLWTDHLCRGVDVLDTEKQIQHVPIQMEGGYQNLFVFAER
jgi:hypothetical protein